MLVLEFGWKIVFRVADWNAKTLYVEDATDGYSCMRYDFMRCNFIVKPWLGFCVRDIMVMVTMVWAYQL